ncbi:EF-hand domain-containing protein [Nannocystis sp. ILAH1]|uniref:EF-hand domain-containing protein n=1 Tax=unclassified Nannocystis TaxID=2627009 RepID=UPI00226F614D|nr:MULTISPECIES: EF-hand domain-containing protein [unclassified Nannocystis]MCY0994035.1 EF-hand domain-containing protein [Nannocystis sp. ILAH1]MCY1067003.1 EF-hand domain-containing protein [Nannocystis sp. RBIL2]
MTMSASGSSAAELTLDKSDVDRLWESFRIFDTDGSGAISPAELAVVMRSLGQSPTEAQVRGLIEEVDTDGSGHIDFGEFKTLMLARYGDRRSRLELAFAVFDRDGSGRITAEEMGGVMSQVGLSARELDEMIKEVDVDGDGSIGFDEFCQLAQAVPTRPSGALETAAPLASAGATAAAIAGEVDARERTEAEPAPAADEPQATVEVEIARLREQNARSSEAGKVRGTSVLQLQIGLFRLIQGAAYRCFRESFSANHETHLRVRNLPYRISEFVPFVRTAMSLYKALGVVEEVCHPTLDAVVESLEAEYARLQRRIADWQTVPKTAEMLAEHEAMVAARSRSENTREKFAAGVEFAISMRKQRLGLGDVVEGVLALNELRRLRTEELAQELAPGQAQAAGDAKAYLDRWHRVILDNALETVDGAMMPVRYWYEDFMPKLLSAFSVSNASHVATCEAPTDPVMDGWFQWMHDAGEFAVYGKELIAAFPGCSPPEKLRLLQSWWLSRHYLNGVQKRRERAEFGRDSGSISQYVSFVDVYVGRNDVRDAQMRVSFPYFIGPAVWRFLHTVAELACDKPAAEQQRLVPVFKQFFKLFATMYPCPYCRHHLNAYVVQNREVDMYPVEYLLLGHDLEATSFNMSIDDKLSSVSDGPSLRLFLWKLHNTVSSSIARSEEWYHRDDGAFYTTRYWPSLAAELARARAFNQPSIPVERVESNFRLMGPVGRLAGVRLELHRLLARGDAASALQAKKIAQDYIRQLESRVIEERFLQDNYHFDANLSDPLTVSFSEAEEKLGRSGLYTED